MKKPDFPSDEETRLKNLQSLNILDTVPEERFDRITRMAKRMFGVPIALLSLVDENRQWFKSSTGLDARETPRDISFCGHTILGNEVFVIPDAAEDERFHDNPLVTEAPFIRFYAGCPLNYNHHKMGTLCIIDTKPREFTPEDAELLKDLAAMMENEMAAFQMATLDELTQISNRRGFMVLGQKFIHYCDRNKHVASLVFFDLNKFKPINDQYGHSEGDKALTHFADIMQVSLRDSDICARIGGDEFVALLPDTPEDGAKIAIEHFQAALSQYNQESKNQYEILFSHGIVEFDPEKHQTIEELLADGDSLMYECKKNHHQPVI